MKARNAAERMQALGEFMEFWLGPRKKSYGVPAAHVKQHSMPMPLKWLYEFAGNWPAIGNGDSFRGKAPILCREDRLRPVRRLKVTGSDKLEFLDENQGCWVCRTLPEGDDPPVWCEGDVYDPRTKDFARGEILIGKSLSKFLVTFTLQELIAGSRRIHEDEPLKRKFKSARKDTIPLWLKGESPDARKPSFWLWNGSLVTDLHWGKWQFAANHGPAIEFLKSKQGAVEILQLTCIRQQGRAHDLWLVSFNRDGSAYASYVESPPFAVDMVYPAPVRASVIEGTFKLPEVQCSLAGLLKRRGDQKKHVEVRLYHTGELGAGAQYLRDLKLFERLFEQVIAAATGKGRLKLNRLFAERWDR